jgi:arylsulfatase A-like enzyme
MLLLGTGNHITRLGQMTEFMNRLEDAPLKGRPGYERYLNQCAAALSEILQNAEYLTTMSGKWYVLDQQGYSQLLMRFRHLGPIKERAPWSRGFDKNVMFLASAGNHCNHEPQNVTAWWNSPTASSCKR